MKDIEIYTDGGARGNPGLSAAAVVALDTSGKVIYQEGVFLGIRTNNYAEYQGALLALKWLVAQRVKEAIVHMDSMLVVNQLNRVYKIKSPDLKVLADQAFTMQRQSELSVNFVYVPREKNKKADALVNLILDENSS